MIPILLNHNVEDLIGTCKFEEHSLLIKFRDDQKITREMFFNSFMCGAGAEYGAREWLARPTVR